MRQERAARGIEHLVARLTREGHCQRRHGKRFVENAVRLRIQGSSPFVAVTVAPEIAIAKLGLPFDRCTLAIHIEAPGQGCRRDSILTEVDRASQLNWEVPLRRLAGVRSARPDFTVVARAVCDDTGLA